MLWCSATRSGLPQGRKSRESKDDSPVLDSETNNIKQIYPNPANDYVMVDFFCNRASNLNLNLVDITGRIVQSLKEQAFEGINTIKINTEDLSRGIYVVKIDDGEQNYTKRFLISK